MKGQKSTEDMKHPEGSLKVRMKFIWMTMSRSFYRKDQEINNHECFIMFDLNSRIQSKSS